ncbi:MAG: nucleotide exchange factor GrpE [Candidatus Eremiobacteraeota bacterium]|nr:nucleotide exchange factor GrpE [Candidatus Eremiobacteraeota bacterium]MCW5869652.1 nucleotide exchange factor GrpE [Candidatus Eremiobacteraeota bacterium]
MPADEDLFSVPTPQAEPEKPPPEPPVPAAVSPIPSPDPDKVEKLERPSEAANESTLAERLQAELRELRDIVHAVEPLSYLRNRVARALDEGADALTLVSFYRLVARSLSEQTEQARRDFEQQRSKVGKLELELATAVAMGAVSEATGAPAKQAATGISEEAEARIAKLELEVVQANEQREKLLLDFKNMRERTQKDLDIKLFREKEKFFGSFLPALDAFDQAQRTGAGATDVASVVQGYGMIYGMILDAMSGEGLEPVDTSGVFDPRYHEAVGEVENNQKPDQHVYDELQRGYRLGERLIRPAMVRISRNPSGIIEPPPEAAEG